MPSKAAQLSPAEPVRLHELIVKSWRRGQYSAHNEGNIPIDALDQAQNVSISQDGSIQPRPQFKKVYSIINRGQKLKILGQLFSFSYKFLGDGNENWLMCIATATNSDPILCLIDINRTKFWTIGPSSVYFQKDNFFRFNKTSYSFYDQVNQYHVNKEYIIITSKDNGNMYVDLSRINLNRYISRSSTDAIILPKRIDNPVKHPAAWFNVPGDKFEEQSGITPPYELSPNIKISFQLPTEREGDYLYSYYYRFSGVNEFGESEASEPISVWSKTPRSLWDNNGFDLKLFWRPLRGAESYNLYMGENNGSETLLATGLTERSWVDRGTRLQFSPRLSPTANSTRGLRCKYSAVVNDRVYLFGDRDNPNYIWYGGFGKNKFSFGPSLESGYEIIGQSSQEEVVSVKPFRNNEGQEVINILTSEKGGRGRRYIMRPTSVEAGRHVYYFHTISETEQEGTNSPDGVVNYRDSIFYPSKTGFKTTGNKPQIQNLVSTDDISQTIRDDINRLDHETMRQCVGIEFRDKIYWAMPQYIGSNEPNSIWEFDLTLGGAWFKDWTFPAKWLTHHDNSNNQETLLAVKDDGDSSDIYRLSDEFDAEDEYQFVIKSGFIKPPGDDLKWMKLNRVYFVLDNPKPPFTITLWGRNRSTLYSVLDRQNYVEERNQATVGWGTRRWGTFGWGSSFEAGIETPPTLFRYKFGFPLTNLVDSVGYTITGTSQAHFQLSAVLFRYVPTLFIDNAGVALTVDDHIIRNVDVFNPPLGPALPPQEFRPLDTSIRDYDYGQDYS